MTPVLAVLAAVAELVLGSADPLAELRSPNALTRATAARVAMARNVTAATPQLRAALAAEADHDAAREQVRALVMLGNDEDVAFAASQLSRYPDSIDAAFADAVARLGGSRPMELYFKHVAGLRHAPRFFPVALWGRPAIATLAASRLLSAKDAEGWDDLLTALESSDMTLSDGIAGIASETSDPTIRTRTLWHLVKRGATRTLAPREGAGVPEAFARELLRRRAGGEPVESKEWTAWLATDEGRREVWQQENLTKAEERVVLRDVARMPPVTKPNLPQPDFTLPVALPRGLASEVLAAAKCAGGPWVGGYTARVDTMGRVAALELDEVTSIGECKSALRALTSLALAQPRRINGGRVAQLIALRQPDASPCFDAAPLTKRGAAGLVAPKVVERAEPRLPGGVQLPPARPAIVALEATISDTGCVRTTHVVSSSGIPAINTEAIIALSKWKFRPGTLHGVPTDVEFNIAISFRKN